MKKEDLENKSEGRSSGALVPILSLLQENNAFLASIADLIIKTSARDKKHLKELSEYFSKRCKVNEEFTHEYLVKMFVELEEEEKKEKLLN